MMTATCDLLRRVFKLLEIYMVYVVQSLEPLHEHFDIQIYATNFGLVQGVAQLSAILYLTQPEIAPFDSPSSKTPA